MKHFFSKQVLVTGGAGFIGSHLVDFLLTQGHYVTVVDNLCNGRLRNLKKWEHHSRLNFVSADIRRSEDLKGLFSCVDWVFHLAALPGVVKSMEKPGEYFETNVLGTYNVLEASRLAGVKRFLYAASASCYQAGQYGPTLETTPIQPQSPYALTKYIGEQLVLHWAEVYKLPALSLRLFNVFGPGLCTTGSYTSVFGTFLAQKLRGEPLSIVGDGNQTRDFIYVSDVVEAFYLAAQSEFSNDAMNVGSGSTYSIGLLAKLFSGPVIYISKRPGEAHCSLANVDKIYKKLSWKAKVSFKEGVSRFLEESLASDSSVNSMVSSEELLDNDFLSPNFFPTQEGFFSEVHTAKGSAC